MPRHNRVERRPAGRVAVVIDSVEHTLSEPAFIALMEAALNVLQALTAERSRPTQTAAGRREQLAEVAAQFSGVVRNGK